nr:PREDICTED: polymeric immunoglobulin receptor-like [Struthio camelus australis]
MELFLLLVALLPDPVSGVLYGSRFLTGEVGGSVTHQCFYSIIPANRFDRKYWCKIAESGVCPTIVSTTGYISRGYKGRVSLEDVPQNGTFIMKITQLKKSDAGAYRCGIGPTNTNLFIPQNLTVLEGMIAARGEGRSCPMGRQPARRPWPPSGVAKAPCRVPLHSWQGAVWSHMLDYRRRKSYEGRIFIKPQESSGAFKILINDLKREDSGLYRCGTGMPSGTDSPRTVDLQVTAAFSDPAASTIRKRPKFLSGAVGGSLSLQCHYDPQRNYKKKYLCRWKEGSCSLLVDADGFVHGSYEGRIQIVGNDQENGTYTVVMSNLREDDAGWYWCGAKNGHTEQTFSLKLRIQKGR